MFFVATTATPGAAHVGKDHLTGLHRSGDGGGVQRTGHLQHLLLGYLPLRPYRHHRQRAAQHPYGAGDGALRVNALLPGVGIATGAGIAGNGGDDAILQRGPQLAAMGQPMHVSSRMFISLPPPRSGM